MGTRPCLSFFYIPASLRAGGGNSINVYGGRGGYTEAVIPTTPGETLFIIVGAGGLGIGSGANYLNLGGGGGGGTAIMRGNIPLLVAGGGGGAGSDNGHDFLLVRWRVAVRCCFACDSHCARFLLADERWRRWWCY